MAMAMAMAVVVAVTVGYTARHVRCTSHARTRASSPRMARAINVSLPHARSARVRCSVVAALAQSLELLPPSSGYGLFSIYGTSRNREMPRIPAPTANPPMWSTRQHWHGSCSFLGMSPLWKYARAAGSAGAVRRAANEPRCQNGTRMHPLCRLPEEINASAASYAQSPLSSKRSYSPSGNTPITDSESAASPRAYSMCL